MPESGSPKKITIHTDGACHGNPGPGGWTALLRYEAHARELAGGEPATTNNRMELQAAISALAALKEPCEITLFTDSEYLRQGIIEWLPRWKANNWQTVDRKPVKNEDLWRQLHEAASRHRVTWQWLKGHVGHPDNEHCDQLARAEVVKIAASIRRKNWLHSAMPLSPAEIRIGARAVCFERSFAGSGIPLLQIRCE